MAKRKNKPLEVDMAKLLGFVNEKDIITIDKVKGIVFIGGEKADEVRLLNLKAESEFLLTSELWKVLNETMKYMAIDMGLVKSKSFEETMSAKMWLYHLNVQKKLLETFKSYKKPTPPLRPHINSGDKPLAR